MKIKLLKSAIMVVLIAMSGNLKAFTAVISGAWSNAATWGGVGPGAMVSNQDVIIPSGLTVDLDMSVVFSGLPVNSFTVDGTLNSSTNSNVTITAGAFAGAGTVNIHRLSLSGVLTTTSFSGSMSLYSLQNEGATLSLAALANISDTLDLDGGTLSLSTGSNLTMAANSKVKVTNGTLTTTGGIFTTGNPYDVWYLGSSVTTGLEINSTSLRNLNVNMNSNSQVVTQGMSNLIVNGNINLVTGEFSLNGHHLTLDGNFTAGIGTSLVSTATSDLTINGSGAMTSGLVFSIASVVNNFEIDRAGNVDLNSSLNVAGTIHLTNGTFTIQNGGTLTMLTGSDVQMGDGSFVQNGGVFVGTARYDVEYIGGQQQAGVELYGSGLDNVSIGLVSNSDTVEMENNVVIHGNLHLMSGMFSLYGYNLTLDSSFSQVPTASIVGDSASDLTLNLVTTPTDTISFGGIKHIRSLTLNIPAASTILIASDLTVHNQLNMMSGKIEIRNSNIILRSAAFINGYSDTKYIVTSGSGQLEMNVNSNSVFVTFPVGSSVNYAPAQIQQTSTGTTGIFKVRAMDGVYTQGTAGYNSATTASVVNKTWLIDAASAVTVNMNLKLGWTVASEVNGFNRNQAYISHYMNSNWDSYTASAAVSGLNNTYEITRTGITSLSPFAVADTSALMSTKENVLTASISIYPNPTIDQVTISSGESHAVYLYELFDVTGKSILTISNSDSTNKFDFTGINPGLYFIRITNTTTKDSVIKRIVKS